DLEEGTSGLMAVQGILQGIEGISFIHLTKSDVVRHQLVARIIEAYEKKENRKGRNTSGNHPGPG
ncbi:PhoH family protein, partial [Candidatus Bipolaricaulota bacterium]|nr:PhoH family protein [Candidatus Bipolaricaulota bacterium]